MSSKIQNTYSVCCRGIRRLARRRGPATAVRAGEEKCSLMMGTLSGQAGYKRRSH